MKKTKLRFICILMIACMLCATALSGCEDRDDSDKTEYRRACTITILTIVEDSTTPEAVAAVEKELTTLSESRYMTKIKLIALKQSEYEAEIERRFGAYDKEVEQISKDASIALSIKKSNDEKARQDKAANITQVTTKKPTEPPSTTEEYTERIIWPEVTPDQIDIFLINSPEMFFDLLEKERLAPMDDELNTKAKVLKEYLHPAVLAAGQRGRTYAIATNKVIGEAVYIAVNKELAEKYEQYTETASKIETENPADKVRLWSVRSVIEYKDMLPYMKWVKENAPNVALFEGPFVQQKWFEPVFKDMPLFPTIAYLHSAGSGERPWVYNEHPIRPTINPMDDSSPRPTTQTDESGVRLSTDRPKDLPPVINTGIPKAIILNQYTNPQYLNIHTLNYDFLTNGLFETSPIPEGKELAMFILQGTLEDMLDSQASEIKRYADGEPVLDENGNTIPIYEYIMSAVPAAKKDDLRSSMYGISVSSLASSKIPVMRCMEILTLMNTNSHFKNTFQYGIEGTHYVYNEDGMIERLNSDYMINMDYTGNNFIADLMEGQNPNKWELAKEHNLNVVMSPLMNFNFDYSRMSVEMEESISIINNLCIEFNEVLKTGRIPSVSELGEVNEIHRSMLYAEDGTPRDEFADALDFREYYVYEYMATLLDEAGWEDLFTEIKSQAGSD